MQRVPPRLALASQKTFKRPQDDGQGTHMPFDSEDNLFLLPGPVKLHPRIQRAMLMPAISHRSPEFRQVIRRMNDGLRGLFQTKHGACAAMTCSATGAMEAAVTNLVKPGQKVVVAHNGKFGRRFLDVARRATSHVVDVGAPDGQPIDAGLVKRALAAGDVRAVALVANESSTGVRNPVEAVAEACREHDALLIVDGVTAYGGMDLPTEKLGIDVGICGSQKAVGAPPGLAFVCVSPEAEQELASSSYYLDLKTHLEKWRQETTPFTPATHMFLAAAEALGMLREEGLEARVRRNRRQADALRTAVATIGLELLAAPGYASDTITAIRYPEGVGDPEVRQVLRDTWGIVVAGGQDSLKGKLLRVAHMGFVQDRELAAFIVALEDVLARAASTQATGAAAGAFLAALSP
jgi:aspartate aminotransferase-like enzyme